MNLKKALIVLGVWISMFAAGGWIGGHYSPEWDDPGVVKTWVAQRLAYMPDSADRNAPGIFRFQCGADSYQYRLGSEAPELGAIGGYWQNEEIRRKPVTVSDINVVAVAIGLPTISKAPELLTSLERLESRSYLAAAIVGGALGIGLGVKMTYRPAPSCDAVRGALKDPLFWKSLNAPAVTRLYPLRQAAPIGVRIP